MHSNKLGATGMQELGKAINTHKQLQYFDISSNNIGSKGFVQLYNKINTRRSTLVEFRCRDNKVGGENLGETLRGISKNLTILDLQGNILEDENAEVLLEYSRRNVFIE